MDFKKEIAAILSKETKLKNKLKKEELANLITIPPDPKLGDYAFPCFKLGKNPKEEAEKLKKEIKITGFVSRIDAVGPYLNFFIKPSIIAENTLKEVYKQQKYYGRQDLGKGKKIIVEFSSPNIAKPFGIGHLRSTMIGNCLYKIYSFLGYRTIGINHLGDWGTQFGKLIIAYKKWGNEKELEKEPIKYLLSLYVKFHEEAEKDETLEEQARAEFKKLEDGCKESLALWELFKELSLQEFKRIYSLLEVEFDSYRGESFYNNLLDRTIEELQKKIKTGIELSEGALIVNLEKFGLAPLMLRKSDGASTYHARDLAAAFYRLQKYKPERIIYVVGSEQKLHFQQLFKVMELAGAVKSEAAKLRIVNGNTGKNANSGKNKLIHVDFGLFCFPEGKMSTRKGNVIFLQEVLERAIDLAEKIIDEKNPNLKNKKEIARSIGIGAIIFADLSNDCIRNIIFDWNKMLSFEGETGPYLQYTHARACSILRKAHKEQNISVSPHVNFETFNLAEEIAIVKHLYAFPEIIVQTAQTYKPHLLAHYLISLAQSFNEFYHKCPVISEQKHVMKARLLLVDCVRQTLENGLNLLGIKAPQEM